MPERLAHEAAAWGEDLLLIGVDEVGRGPLAGPVVAAAVVFPKGQVLIPEIRDSKRVGSARRRAALVEVIEREALAVGVGAASVSEIATYNIRRATVLAMRRAIDQCRRHLGAAPTTILVDGVPLPELGEPHGALVGGDGRCQSIAAASLVAKVIRDTLMARLARRRPGYGWESNAGYGTAAHLHALRASGLTPHHRATFCATALRER